MRKYNSRHQRALLLSAAVPALVATGSAQATMTLSLRLASGASSVLLSPDQNNTDIAIQVWATVNQSQALNPVPTAGNYGTTDPQVQTGLFAGLQYAYYNIMNTSATGSYVAGGIETAANGTGPTLNPFLKFNANGSQSGQVQNVQGGVSVGSNTSITGVAKPRAARAVFDNQSYFNQSAGYYQQLGNDGINITASGTTASFLLETVYFKQSTFNAQSQTTFSLASPSAALTASAATDLSPANWFQNITSQNIGVSQPTSTYTDAQSGPQSGSPTIGSAITIRNTLNGDADLDGSVGPSDFLILRRNYNIVTSGAKWAQGDFNNDGAVGPADFLLLRANYNTSLTTSSATAASAKASASAAKSAAAKSPSPTAGQTLTISTPTFSSITPAVTTSSPQTPPAGRVLLVVYTNTGDAQLVFNNASLSLYNITSANGLLVPANWSRIGSQSAYSQNGFVSLSNSTRALSEGTFDNGPTLTNGVIDLGNIFSLNVPAGSRDLMFSEADNAGNLYTLDVNYVDSAPEPASLGLAMAASAGLLGRRRRRSAVAC